MPKANELKRGMVIDLNGIPHAVKNVEAKSPSSRGATTLYKIRFKNLKTGQKLDESYKSDDLLKEADCVRVSVQYSYSDGDKVILMNSEDYSQYEVDLEDIEDLMPYITEGLEGLTALIMDGVLLSIELPQSVELKITETAPAIKGATAASRTKPATLSTGLEVQVPEYIESGEVIKVNTGTGKFMSRT
ncbi:MAG: elongation factor P-like protein YeiP [Gammaproteobacteria bacterium]|nr:elongation factor P-like protein YeiP [Gammaproteobacteria bacterium]